MAFEAAAQQEGTQVGSRSPRVLEKQGAHFTQNAMKVVHPPIASLLKIDEINILAGQMKYGHQTG